MNVGDRINLKDGRKAIITKVGMGDFFNDPRPIYYMIEGTVEKGILMSDELKPREK